MGVADLLEYLTPEEQGELDTHLSALRAIGDHAAYREDPVGWMRDVLEIPEHTIRWSLNKGYDTHQWDGTPDPLVRMLEALALGKDAGIESGTGTGKSFTAAAGGVLWFLACWYGSRVFTFAPKEDQLRLYIWAEIAKLWPRFQKQFPKAELSDLRIRMDGTDGWGAWGYAVGVRADEESASKAQGMHAEHMLLIYEEMPGIPLPVITAGENTCTAPHNLRLGLGNPDHQLDALHTFCTSHGVEHVRCSALDHPNVVTGNANVVPGAVSQKKIDNRRAKYGEDSPLYESRVRGISPAQSTDALIRKEWLDRAAARFTELAKAGAITGRPAKGVDVANSENGDKGSIADYMGAALVSIRAFACPDANKLGTNVNAEMALQSVPQEHVGVDPVGVGAGTVNELARLGKIVRRLNGAAKPVTHAEKQPDGKLYDWAPDSNLFANLRSQMWWQFREDLRNDRIPIHPDIVAKYAGQFTLFTYEIKSGKVIVESKIALKKRTGADSPNEADSAVYGNWVRPRAALRDMTEPTKKQDQAKEYDYAKRQWKKDLDPETEMRGGTRRLTRRVSLPRYRGR